MGGRTTRWCDSGGGGGGSGVATARGVGTWEMPQPEGSLG